MVESEFGAMSACIGASAAGGRAYTATASQGLLFMAEALPNASGLRLPIVMTVANRALGAPINIWNDHSDAMSQRDSGWVQLFAESNQEAVDLHVQAFALAEQLSVPVMVCMDGFVLTHAMEAIDVPEQELVDAVLPPWQPAQRTRPRCADHDRCHGRPRGVHRGEVPRGAPPAAGPGRRAGGGGALRASISATVLTVSIHWHEALHGLLVPTWQNSKSFISLVVAVLGTTISPYLYFWQSSQEAEDQREQPRRKKLTEAPEQAPAAFERIGLDTWIGMALSNLVALAIMLTAGATLHVAGKTDIDSSQMAAEALRPIAGEFAFLIFALGIIGTGFMAVPVLAGSAAYAVGEALRWPVVLARQPKAARAFYVTLAVATALGTAINFLPVDPIRALYWSAVINGVMGAPIIVVMMNLASDPRVMGRFTLSSWLKIVGWITAAVMAVCVVGLIASFAL